VFCTHFKFERHKCASKMRIKMSVKRFILYVVYIQIKISKICASFYVRHHYVRHPYVRHSYVRQICASNYVRQKMSVKMSVKMYVFYIQIKNFRFSISFLSLKTSSSSSTTAFISALFLVTQIK
jgi:hypothetical protein